MKINEDLIVVNGKKIGTYDLYDITGLVKRLTPDEAVQETLLTGSQTILEVLQNCVDQQIISSFRIEHK